MKNLRSKCSRMRGCRSAAGGMLSSLPLLGRLVAGVSARSCPRLQERQLTLINHREASRAHRIHSTFYSKREHLMAVGGGSGDVKGHWLIPSSRAQGRGTSRDAEQERQEGAVPLRFISRESAFLGSLGITKNKS